MPEIIKTPPASKEYRDNFDRVFRVKHGLFGEDDPYIVGFERAKRIYGKVDNYLESCCSMIIKTLDGDIVI